MLNPTRPSVEMAPIWRSLPSKLDIVARMDFDKSADDETFLKTWFARAVLSRVEFVSEFERDRVFGHYECRTDIIRTYPPGFRLAGEYRDAGGFWPTLAHEAIHATRFRTKAIEMQCGVAWLDVSRKNDPTVWLTFEEAIADFGALMLAEMLDFNIGAMLWRALHWSTKLSLEGMGAVTYEAEKCVMQLQRDAETTQRRAVFDDLFEYAYPKSIVGVPIDVRE